MPERSAPFASRCAAQHDGGAGVFRFAWRSGIAPERTFVCAGHAAHEHEPGDSLFRHRVESELTPDNPAFSSVICPLLLRRLPWWDEKIPKSALTQCKICSNN